MIQGGWEFVWSAYGIVWTVLTVYGASLYTRHKRAQAAAEAAHQPEMRA
jgi:hypothetical protein